MFFASSIPKKYREGPSNPLQIILSHEMDLLYNNNQRKWSNLGHTFLSQTYFQIGL